MSTLGVSRVSSTAAQQVQPQVKVVRGSYLDEKIMEEEILKMTGKEKLSDLIHNDDKNNQIKMNVNNNKTNNQKNDTKSQASSKTVIIMKNNPSQNLNFTTRNHAGDYADAKFGVATAGSFSAFCGSIAAFTIKDISGSNSAQAIKFALKVACLGAAVVAGLYKYFDYKEEKEHLKIHNQVTHNKLTQAFCKNGSDGGARITYDEQCQIREMIDRKNTIFEKYSPKSNERYNLEEYYNKMIDQFSSPESEDGERITYFEQCQLNEIASSRSDLLDNSLF